MIFRIGGGGGEGSGRIIYARVGQPSDAILLTCTSGFPLHFPNVSFGAFFFHFYPPLPSRNQMVRHSITLSAHKARKTLHTINLHQITRNNETFSLHCGAVLATQQYYQVNEVRFAQTLLRRTELSHYFMSCFNSQLLNAQNGFSQHCAVTLRLIKRI